jgi:hypothetical protein
MLSVFARDEYSSVFWLLLHKNPPPAAVKDGRPVFIAETNASAIKTK